MVMIENFVSETEKFTLDGVSSDTLGLYCDFLPPMPNGRAEIHRQ